MRNISRGRGTQAMKLAQLIENNMRNIFLENSFAKCSGDTIPDPFLKNKNRTYLWINSLKFYTACFYSMPN